MGGYEEGQSAKSADTAPQGHQHGPAYYDVTMWECFCNTRECVCGKCFVVKYMCICL